MNRGPSGTFSPNIEATSSLECASAVCALPRPKHHSKRAEDTGAGCRAKAAADLARAGAPGGDYMRGRLEHSAAMWSERASLLERLEKKFALRTRGA